MASPLPEITVTGQFVTLDNLPAEGYVTLTPVAPRTVGDGWIIVGATVTGYVRHGLLSTTIIADSVDLTNDLYVRVVEHIDDTPTETYIVQPQGVTLDLATVPRVSTPPPGQAYVPASALGQPNGVATLGGDGLLTAAQRPPGGGGGVTDHGALTGLADDDHTQYLNTARGDARYYTQAAINASLAGKENTGVAAGLVTAHTGAADPHAQYTTAAELATALGSYATQSELSGGLLGKADVNHTHVIANVTGLQAAINAKEDTGVAAATMTAHLAAPDPHTQYITGDEATGMLSGYLPLGGGTVSGPIAWGGTPSLAGHLTTKAYVDDVVPVTYADLTGTVPTSALPALAIGEVFPVASQAAMLALTAQRGDVAIRSDIAATFILATDSPSTLADWKQLATPADAVLSVNGQTGVVVLAKGDVGLSNVDNTADTAKPVSTAAQTALDGKVDEATLTTKGDLYIATAAGTVVRLGVGSDGQVLTADAAQTAGAHWATPPAGGLEFDPLAVRYGCKAITMDPRTISWVTPQYIEMVVDRLYQFWVPLPQGTTVTGVRMPVQFHSPSGGTLEWGVYQDDNTPLGSTGDVSATFEDTGIDGTWVTVPLTAAAASTGPGVWITGLATVTVGPKMVFCNTDGGAPIPGWLLNPSTHRTVLRTEGLGALPATLNPAAGTLYIDFLIGVV